MLPALAEQVRVPPAVFEELAECRVQGVNLPSLQEYAWIMIQSPHSARALPLIADLGSGEREVWALALESDNCVTVLDDEVVRRAARRLDLGFRLLLDA